MCAPSARLSGLALRRRTRAQKEDVRGPGTTLLALPVSLHLVAPPPPLWVCTPGGAPDHPRNNHFRIRVAAAGAGDKRVPLERIRSILSLLLILHRTQFTVTRPRGVDQLRCHGPALRHGGDHLRRALGRRVHPARLARTTTRERTDATVTLNDGLPCTRPMPVKDRPMIQGQGKPPDARSRTPPTPHAAPATGSRRQ